MSTSFNDLVSALNDEAQARQHRYGELVGQAEAMGYPQAARFFRAIAVAETVRFGQYRACLTSSGRQMETHDYYVCPGCGYVSAGGAPTQCPVCETPEVQFERIGDPVQGQSALD